MFQLSAKYMNAAGLTLYETYATVLITVDTLQCLFVATATLITLIPYTYSWSLLLTFCHCRYLFPVQQKPEAEISATL